METKFKKIDFSEKDKKRMENHAKMLKILDEFSIVTPEELEIILHEYTKNSEELYFCERCGCKSLRESDCYCPECGGRVED